MSNFTNAPYMCGDEKSVYIPSEGGCECSYTIKTVENKDALASYGLYSNGSMKGAEIVVPKDEVLYDKIAVETRDRTQEDNELKEQTAVLKRRLDVLTTGDAGLVTTLWTGALTSGNATLSEPKENFDFIDIYADDAIFLRVPVVSGSQTVPLHDAFVSSGLEGVIRDITLTLSGTTASLTTVETWESGTPSSPVFSGIKRIDGIKPSGSFAAEVQDIRTGYDGTVYSSAGDAVRAQAFRGTDTTLSVSGMAADAKVVGDDITNLKSDLSETTRNLFEGKYTDFNGMELSNGKVVNTATDSRTSFYCVVRFRNGDTNVTVSSAEVISTTGRHSITITPSGNGNNVFMLHSGASKNLTFYFPLNFTSGTTYTVSFNIEGYNPSVVGGLVISDIQIETGDTATAYVPHIVATDYVARSSIDIVEGEISAVRNDIIQINDDVIDIRDELYNAKEKTITAQPSGYRLNESDGLCSANSSYKLVKWIVTAGDYIKIESDDRWQFQTVASVPSSGTSNRIGQTYGEGVFYATVPEGATYLVGSTPVSNSKFKAYNAYAKINSIQEDVLDNNILLYAIGAQTLLCNDAYMNQLGEVTNNSYFKTSDYILVKQGQIVKYKLDSNDSTAIICFFSDKTVSSFVSYVAGTGELSEGTFTVPYDGYIRFSTRTSTIAEAYCYIQSDVSPNFSADTMQKIFAGKKIVVFGDSIMADSSCSSTIAEVTGATVYNCAIGGTLMAYGSDSYNIICGAKIAEAINNDSLDDIDVSGLGLSYGNAQHWNALLGIDFTQIDMAVVSYGTNDFSFNVPTTSGTAFDKTAMKTAVDYFISVMNAKYPNVQLCFFTPSYRHRTAWSGDSDEVTNGIGKHLVDYEDAIYTACQENHVPCKKMYHSCGVNKYNYETYLSDGLHRTAKGGTLIGHQYAGFLEDNVI